ncbi:MBL fold metallo-hydrolase [candidate division KSB1 bacterium]
MNIGEFEILTAWDGFFKLDGGAMFGVVPKLLWNKSDPSDGQNRIMLGLNPMVIRWDNNVFLIDTGIGDKWDEKNADILQLDRSNSLVKSLKELNISREDVTGVIQTHLHFDHAGGSTEKDNNEIIPTFPNATYYIQQGEWNFALNTNERTRASYLDENFVPLRENKQVEFLHGDEKIDRCIHVHVTGGHTPHHQIVFIETGGKKVCYMGDIIPTASHLKIPYIMGYDTHPMDTLREKKQLIDQALHENWLVVFAHSPRMRAGYLEDTTRGIKLSPIDLNRE